MADAAPYAGPLCCWDGAQPGSQVTCAQGFVCGAISCSQGMCARRSVLQQRFRSGRHWDRYRPVRYSRGRRGGGRRRGSARPKPRSDPCADRGRAVTRRLMRPRLEQAVGESMNHATWPTPSGGTLRSGSSWPASVRIGAVHHFLCGLIRRLRGRRRHGCFATARSGAWWKVNSPLQFLCGRE